MNFHLIDNYARIAFEVASILEHEEARQLLYNELADEDPEAFAYITSDPTEEPYAESDFSDLPF